MVIFIFQELKFETPSSLGTKAWSWEVIFERFVFWKRKGGQVSALILGLSEPEEEKDRFQDYGPSIIPKKMVFPGVSEVGYYGGVVHQSLGPLLMPIIISFFTLNPSVIPYCGDISSVVRSNTVLKILPPPGMLWGRTNTCHNDKERVS